MNNTTENFVQYYQTLFFDASLQLKVKFTPQLLTYEPLFDALCKWCLHLEEDEFIRVDQMQAYFNRSYTANFSAYVAGSKFMLFFPPL